MAAPQQTPAPSAPLPEPLTLPALQRYVARVVAEQGFTGELERVFILFVEELGELAEEVAARRADGAGRHRPRMRAAPAERPPGSRRPRPSASSWPMSRCTWRTWPTG